MAELELTDSVAVDATEVTNFLGLSDPAFLAYEYQQYLPDCAVFVQARSDGRLIGTLALMPYPLVIGGRVMMTGHAERGRVDPAYRGGGLFPALTEKCAQAAAAKGLQFIWGSTTGKMAFQRVGFLFFEGFYEHAMLCVKPGAGNADLRRPQRKQLRAAKMATALPSLAIRFASTLAGRSELEIGPALRRPEDVFDLYERMRGDQRLVVMHHEERFISWLLDQGGRTIRRYFAYSGPRLVAYAYVDVSPGTTAELIDFAGEDVRSLRQLVRYLVRDLAAANTAFVHVAYNWKNPWLRRLRRGLMLEGFVPFYRGGGFVIRPLDFRDLNYLNDLSRWYITGMWFQLYPGT